MSSAMQSLRARWVFPVDRPPLRDGVIEIVNDQIATVRHYRVGDKVDDLGDIALLPGLVNAHTHLEFSDLRQPLGEPLMAFPDWIRLVIEHRRVQAGNWQTQAVYKGLAESAAASVALLGEIATYGSAGASPSQDSPSQVLFAELLGLSTERIESLWRAAQAHLAHSGPLAPREESVSGTAASIGANACLSWSERATMGLSPHATYTVHPQLLTRVCQFSGERGFPIAMHVAESLDEIELLQSGSGRLVELLDSLNAFPRGVIARATRPLQYLQILAYAAKSLVIHGNYLAGDEIEFAGQRSERMSVVYCPRTHAYFNAGDYPLAEMLAANVNVCLGTDSRASNPDLNLFEEMRFVAQRHLNVTPEGVLYLGTQAGADALGLGDRFGSITTGKSARLTKLTLPSLVASDPHELLFAEGTRTTAL